jgi:hypothetical protein
MSENSDAPYDFAPPKAPADGEGAAKAPVPAGGAKPPLPERLCPQCGFKIMVVPRNKRCPECRAPLDDSLADCLPYARPAWIRRLSWGAFVMALAVPAHVSGVLVTVVQQLPVRGAALQVAGGVMALLGIFLVTLREKGKPQRRAFLAVAARVLALGVTVLLGVAMYLISQNSAATIDAVAPALVAMALEAVAFGFFASALAARIPHEGLEHQLRNFALLLPPFLWAVLVSLLVDLTPYAAAFFCAYPLIGAMLGLLAWVTLTLLRLMLELRHAAEAAEAMAARRAAIDCGKPVTRASSPASAEGPAE